MRPLTWVFETITYNYDKTGSCREVWPSGALTFNSSLLSSGRITLRQSVVLIRSKGFHIKALGALTDVQHLLRSLKEEMKRI